MRNNISTFAKSTRLVLVTLLTLSLLVSVGYTGQGKIVFKPVVTAASEQPADAASGLQAAPVTPEQAGGKMAPSKTKHSSPAAFTASPVVYKSGNDNSRFNNEPTYACDFAVHHRIKQVKGQLPNSISMISSSLGRQFTLVGAKPSGTM